MNRIILVRHGEPDVPAVEKISGKEIADFLHLYDHAPLKAHSNPSDRLQFLAHNATVVCSHLPRSLASAARCGVEPKIIDALFAESIPPHFRTDRLSMRPKSWLMLSRVLWMGGFSRHGESLRSARMRAQKAEQTLHYEAMQRDVLLFGHGLFNIMIAKALRSYGYSGPKVPARAFWEFGIYRRG